jgi:hypothetical protein
MVAVFLLISQEPSTAALVFALGLGVGSLAGSIVEALHGPDFLRAQTQRGPAEIERRARRGKRARAQRPFDRLWLALMIPGVVFALPIAAQVDPNAWFGPLADYEPVTLLGFAGGLLALVMGLGHGTIAPGEHREAGPAGPLAANPNDAVAEPPTMRARIINDTNFVTVWVIAAFLLFELGIHATGADVAGWFAAWAPLAPLIAVLVGFLPGCGPQIIVTTLYLTGVIPMSALLANAIANDGDALFPAIALAPRAAIVATLYTGVPALLVGYGHYFAMTG